MATFTTLLEGNRWRLDLAKSSDGKWEKHGKVRRWLDFDVTHGNVGTVYWLVVGGYALAFGIITK